MPAPLIPLLRQQIVNGSGAPYAGALLYAYAAGTTNAQDTYSNSTLTTPNANPVVADADGRFGSIYLDPALNYKFVLKTSAGVEVFTQDQVTVSGAQQLTVLSKIASYSLLVGDGEDVILLCDATAGSMTISLYTAVGNSGRKVRAVKIDSTANTVTLDPSGSQTWNGAASLVLSNQYESVSGVSDGSNWIQFAASNFGYTVSSGVVDWTGRIRTTNVGPHAVGVTFGAGTQWKQGGTFAPTGATGRNAAMEIATTITMEANASGAGVYVNPTFTEAGSGTHALVAGVWVPQFTITNAAAAVTTAAGIYVANAPSVTGATAYAIYAAAGAVKLSGAVTLDTTLGVTGVATFTAQSVHSTGLSSADDIVFSADKVLRRSTSDGSDSGSIILTGGGASGDTRGGQVELYGNENAAAGKIVNRVGNVAGSAFTVVTPSQTALQILGTDGSATFTSSKSTAAWIFDGTSGVNGTYIDFRTQGNSRLYFATGASIAGTNGVAADGVISAPAGDLILMSSNAVRPGSNGGTKLGISASRWSEIWVTTGAFNTSDERTKDILGPAPGLAFIKAIKPIAYRFKADPKRLHYGVGARQVGTLVSADAAMVYRDDENGWGFNYGELTAPIIASIQELTMRLEQVEATRK